MRRSVRYGGFARMRIITRTFWNVNNARDIMPARLLAEVVIGLVLANTNLRECKNEIIALGLL
jgi:hypothetical protein